MMVLKFVDISDIIAQSCNQMHNWHLSNLGSVFALFLLITYAMAISFIENKTNFSECIINFSIIMLLLLEFSD